MVQVPLTLQLNSEKKDITRLRRLPAIEKLCRRSQLIEASNVNDLLVRFGYSPKYQPVVYRIP